MFINTLIISTILVAVIMLALGVKLLFNKDAELQNTPVPLTMAFDRKGDYWISDSKIVQNPYLGTKMPTCGDVKEEL